MPAKNKRKYKVAKQQSMKSMIKKKVDIRLKRKLVLPKIFKRVSINPKNGEINICDGKVFESSNTPFKRKAQFSESFKYISEDQSSSKNAGDDNNKIYNQRKPKKMKHKSKTSNNEDKFPKRRKRKTRIELKIQNNIETPNVCDDKKNGRKIKSEEVKCELQPNVSEDSDFCTLPKGRTGETGIEVPIKDNIRSILHNSEMPKVKVGKTVSFSAECIQNDDKQISLSVTSTTKKKKFKKKKKSKSNAKPPLKSPDRKHKAICYLQTWKRDRNNWKFEKLTQLWLFKNIFNKSEIPDKIFQIFLEYTVNLKGGSKNMAKKICEKIIKEKEENSKAILDNMNSKEDLEISYVRARSLLQHLQ